MGAMTQEEQELNDARYANCLTAMIDCINKGVSVQTLQTLKFELAIDKRDYQKIMDYCLAKKYAGMR